jgi:hypothetical protein
LLSGTAFAQSPAAPRPLEPERVAAITAADNNQRTGLPSSGVAFEATNDASEVSLTLKSKSNGMLQEGGEESWSLVAKAPLDKDSGEGDFVTEGGLSDQFALEAGYHLILDPGIGADLSEAAEAAAAKFIRNCPAQAGNHAEFPKAKPVRAEESALSPAAQEVLRYQRQAALDEERKSFATRFCTGAGIFGRPDAELATYGLLEPADIAAIRNEQRRRRNRDISVLNLTSSMGYGRFSYRDRISFAETKDHKVSFAMSFSAGIHPGRNAPFFGAGYEYKRAYKAADKTVICAPGADGTAAGECRNAVFDAPKRNTSHTLFALVRYADFTRDDPRAFRLPIAVELRAGFDVHDKIFGVSVPTYFFLDDKKSFRGGAKFSWAERTADSRKDEFKFGVFVVKSFDLFEL